MEPSEPAPGVRPVDRPALPVPLAAAWLVGLAAAHSLLVGFAPAYLLVDGGALDPGLGTVLLWTLVPVLAAVAVLAVARWRGWWERMDLRAYAPRRDAWALLPVLALVLLPWAYGALTGRAVWGLSGAPDAVTLVPMVLLFAVEQALFVGGLGFAVVRDHDGVVAVGLPAVVLALVAAAGRGLGPGLPLTFLVVLASTAALLAVRRRIGAWWPLALVTLGPLLLPGAYAPGWVFALTALLQLAFAAWLVREDLAAYARTGRDRTAVAWAGHAEAVEREEQEQRGHRPPGAGAPTRGPARDSGPA